MFGQLEIFQVAYGLARHLAARQATIAANIANADTPGYRAQDIKPFETSIARKDVADGLRVTRPGHALETLPGHIRIEAMDRSSDGNPNGNTVSLESEIVEATRAKQQHDRAVTIYQTAIGILRSSVRSGR